MALKRKIRTAVKPSAKRLDATKQALENIYGFIVRRCKADDNKDWPDLAQSRGQTLIDVGRMINELLSGQAPEGT